MTERGRIRRRRGVLPGVTPELLEPVAGVLLDSLQDPGVVRIAEHDVLAGPVSRQPRDRERGRRAGGLACLIDQRVLVLAEIGSGEKQPRHQRQAGEGYACRPRFR